MKSSIKPWETLHSEKIFTAEPWVKLYKDAVKLASGRVITDYYRISLPEYVMICAMNAEKDILFERRYLHALGSVNISLPSGCIEDNEQPLEAAKRELMEETGYCAEEWESFGSYCLDGNKGCGKAHFFVARNIVKTGNPVEDDMEEVECFFLAPEEALENLLRNVSPLLPSTAFIAMVTNPLISRDQRT